MWEGSDVLGVETEVLGGTGFLHSACLMGRNVRIELRARHAGQERMLKESRRFNVAMCGRRFGKTEFGLDVAIEAALAGKLVGWMAPSYKILAPSWDALVKVLMQVPSATKNELQKVIKLPNGGAIECWSLDGEDPARSRKFHVLIVDEAGLVNRLAYLWHNALRATLADYEGSAWFLGTPKGVGDFSAFYALGQGAGHDPEWASWRMPTSENPFIAASEIDAMRRTMPDLSFRQEILAEPIDAGEHPIGVDHIAACVGPLSTNPVVCWGVDLARSVDFTVAIGLDRDGKVASVDRWKSPWGVTRTRLIGLLGTSTITHIDSTGVGDPIVEDLQRAGVRCVGVVFTAREKQHMVEGLIAAIQQRKIQFPDGWLRGELDSMEATKTQVGTRYAAPEGLNDDGIMALALAWKSYSTTIRPNVMRPDRPDIPEGVSPRFDYKTQRQRTRETGEEALERLLRVAPTSPIAGRYTLPRRRFY